LYYWSHQDKKEYALQQLSRAATTFEDACELYRLASEGSHERNRAEEIITEHCKTFDDMALFIEQGGVRSVFLPDSAPPHGSLWFKFADQLIHLADDFGKCWNAFRCFQESGAGNHATQALTRMAGMATAVDEWLVVYYCGDEMEDANVMRQGIDAIQKLCHNYTEWSHIYREAQKDSSLDRMAQHELEDAATREGKCPVKWPKKKKKYQFSKSERIASFDDSANSLIEAVNSRQP
jgi:hypothetical protein